MLKWCLETAQEKNLREEDYWGGFVIDEMKMFVSEKKLICYNTKSVFWIAHTAIRILTYRLHGMG